MGVRMLVPLVDMLNHGGDQTESGMLADPDHAATDNVRYGCMCGEGKCGGSDGERYVGRPAGPCSQVQCQVGGL